jgi:N-acetylmuramoyl-L-alanine amidase
MSRSHRTALTVFVLACLCAADVSSAAAPARSLRAIRFHSQPDRTRVVLDLSCESRYSVRTARDPFRIVIDLPDFQIVKGVRKIDVRDGLVDRIRVNRLRVGAQVVLDLPRSAEYAHFALKPAAGKPHRVVIDVSRPAAGAAEVASGPPAGSPPVERPPVAPPARGGDRIVIIDPGHGGRHTGTISRSGIQEKTLTLKLAKLLKAEIERHPGYRAVLVREGDYHFDEELTVDLKKRLAIAREKGGDVFVSLHFNSNKSSKLRGLELYFLSLEASDENAGAVAERENLFSAAGADSEGFNDDLRSILFDVSLANAIQQSSAFADDVASVMRVDPPIPFRKVRQGPFLVLRGLSMPSILVEGGYLSNRKEASIISKDTYLRWLAKSLAEGIVSYLGKHPSQAGSSAGK